ncbi:hypothetical protein BD309DRAFT_947521 [Dichomitus squalens]|uniref:Uncharacterized protein n=1 Tax=Dichomitus squalens TaxID=114155 RepID=A0A4Q9Q8Z2_9APHY|nr:hypothetical protein BD309DRAFT_947521 [Dichomitus squalens]TBU64043.1 hypothetical protein BD310DRAFT_915243 [Dichomitus squalens]
MPRGLGCFMLCVCGSRPTDHQSQFVVVASCNFRFTFIPRAYAQDHSLLFQTIKEKQAMIRRCTGTNTTKTPPLHSRSMDTPKRPVP